MSFCGALFLSPNSFALASADIQMSRLTERHNVLGLACANAELMHDWMNAKIPLSPFLQLAKLKSGQTSKIQPEDNKHTGKSDPYVLLTQILT